ncbi:MAG: S8 family serine peptidase, partial [Streptomyces sp.]|uniref:S8 family peptidase n=1 Tax=Streptomyces sp. TaxID=1931 RepID=UPI0025E17C5A
MTHRRCRPLAVAVAALVAMPVALVGAPAAQAAPSAASVRSQEWWLDDLHLPAAWSTTKGKGVVVGLVDTGVDATHPDLTGALVPGKDFSGHGAANGEAPVSGQPEPQHGTTMAGYIVGRGHGPGHAQGMLGAAPEARVMSLSLVDTGGDAPVASAIKYAADHRVKVINLSVDNVESAAIRDALKYAEQHDVVVVVASGNDGQDNGMNSYATYPGVVAVSGYVNDGHFTIDSDSNITGPQTDEPTSDRAADYLGGVAVSAPYETHDGRQDMVGTTTVTDGSYTEVGGTSNSAAIVSGVVALIRSAHPDWNAAQVIDVLIHTAYRQLPEYSPKHGFGIPDAAKAVAASAPSVCDNPLGSLVTNSAGVWAAIVNKKDALAYTPRCGSSSSSPPSSPSSPATQSTGASSPASFSPSSASAGASGSSGGVPAWVWIVVAVVVVGGAAGLLLARRGRGGPPPPGPPAPNAP